MPQKAGIALEPAPHISVIIPTYNRKASLLRTLESLTQQSLPMDKLMVIVVDDGSPDDTHTITSQQYPFGLRYVRQKNQGATAARNHGAEISPSDILVFIDDDITISPHTLEALAQKCVHGTKVLAMGTILKRSCNSTSVYTPIVLTMADHALIARDDVEFHFVDCNSELLACRRRDFFEIGMFQDPTEGHGWPNWDDVDFGYRAHVKGFRLVGISQAIAEHWDPSISDRTIACQRFYRAARSAVWLFNRHPELKTHIPMLYDKIPMAWGQDSALLIVRKLARQLLSSPPILGSMVKLTGILEQYYPSPAVLRRLYYLLHGANLFHGYRKGLSDYRPAGVEE